MKILFTGGGSGGHILPIIAVSREIRRIYKGKKKLRFFYIGPKDDFGQILLSQEGIKSRTILAGKIRRYFTLSSFFQNIIDIVFKMPLGVLQAFFHLFFIAPDLIFSKGGYGSLPATIAGWLFRVDIFLHESDISPGAANRVASRMALEIFVSFPKTEYFPLKKMILTGNPVRREILAGTKEEAKNFFNISGQKPVVLILGGSQGAQRINDKILEILPQILKPFDVIHQCGEKNYKKFEAESKTMILAGDEKFYHLFPFLREGELTRAYAVSDIIVSRAGSGSIFEIAAVAKPSILIPLTESAQNHQIKNAYAYAQNGASMIMEESNFTSRFFLEKLKSFFAYPKETEKMREAAREFSKPRAAKVLAEYIISYLTE